jgi:hypothetical protein
MPRIFLPNTEDVADSNDILYESTQVVKSWYLCMRSFFCLEKGDLIVIPKEPEAEFANYARMVNRFEEDDNFYIVLNKTTKPYSLVESILQDQYVLNILNDLSKSGKWVLDAYMNTISVAKLSNQVNIPLKGISYSIVEKGLPDKLNNKYFFKILSKDLGIEVAPFIYADNVVSIVDAMKKISGDGYKTIILKKIRNAGGDGNLVGSKEELLGKLHDWYNIGGVLVEPYIDLCEVIGSLVDINNGYYKWRGINKQFIADSKWNGFSYPHAARQLTDDIKRLSIKYAVALYEMGARGCLNIDWGVVKKDNGLTPLALEINFRHNGFAYILDMAEKYFGPKGSLMNIAYHSEIKLRNNKCKFTDLLYILRNISVNGESILIDKSHKGAGVIITQLLNNEKFGLAIFGESEDYVNEAYLKVMEAIE